MSAFLLIGTIVFGMGMAGVVMLGFRVVGSRAPRWLVPTVAGASMLGFHIWMETTWFDRIRLQLSESIVVVETHGERNWWQPWTFIQPQIVRFSAFDGATVQSLPEGRVHLELWLVDRYHGSHRVPQVYDCAEPRRADLIGEARLDERGRLVEAEWISIAPDDLTRQVACNFAASITD